MSSCAWAHWPPWAQLLPPAGQPTATPVPPTATKPPCPPTAVPPTAVPPTAAPPAAAPAADAAGTRRPPVSSKYKEAPMLAELVKAGKLPAVDQRLPKNPCGHDRYEGVGKYGGTWRRAFNGVSDSLGAHQAGGPRAGAGSTRT